MKKLSIILLFILFSMNCKVEKPIVFKEFPTLKSKDFPGRTEALLWHADALQQRTTAKPQGGWFFTGTGTEMRNNLVLSGGSSTFNYPKFGQSTLQAAWIAVYFAPLPDGRRPWAQWGVGKGSYVGNISICNFFYLGQGLSGEFSPPIDLVTGGQSYAPGDILKWTIMSTGDFGWWYFMRNDVPIWKFYIPSTHVTKVEIMVETQDSRIPRFPATTFYPALEVKDTIGWTLLQNAFVQQCNHGIVGRDQGLPDYNMVKMGGATICQIPGTQLW